MNTIGQVQFGIKRIIDGKTLTFMLSTNGKASTQIFAPDPATYAPDYTVSNLVITPDLLVSGEPGSQISRLKQTPVWTINDSTDLASFGAIASATAPYALTIKKNIVDAPQLSIICKAIYVQPITKNEIPVICEKTITKVSNSGASIIARLVAPKGTAFKNDQIKELTCECDMWRGSQIDDTKVVYSWEINNDGTWKAITDANAATYGITGFKTRSIVIPSKAILNFGSVKCNCKDDDVASPTYGKIVYDVLSFNDFSDPYEVTYANPQGDGLGSGITSISYTINVYQGGIKLPDTFFANRVCSFYRCDPTGAVDKTWGTDGFKQGRTQSFTLQDCLDVYVTMFGAKIDE